jgi:lysozyme
MYYGVDVSDWQGPINWKAVTQDTNPKISFAYAKATDGVGFVSTTFADNHDACGELGLPFGAYHFFRFEDDPNAQADYFISVTMAAGRSGLLIPMVDVETGTASTATLETFVQRVQTAFKIPYVLIYTDSGYWDGSGLGDGFAGHPLWIANFVHSGNDPEGSPALPTTGGWKAWTVWQYDNEGEVAGIGNTDLDQAPSIDALRRPVVH